MDDLNDELIDAKHEWINKCIREWMNGWANKLMNELVNKFKKIKLIK